MNPQPSEQAERLQDLLLEVLAPICTARKLDQLEALDVSAAAGDAWRDFLIENPELEADPWWSSREVIGALDSVIVATLSESASEVAVSAEASMTEAEAEADVLTPESMEVLLGEWLSAWHRRLCAIDPLAAEVVLLRLRGFGNRAISEGLETGLRLTTRIAADICNERMELAKDHGEEVA